MPPNALIDLVWYYSPVEHPAYRCEYINGQLAAYGFPSDLNLLEPDKESSKEIINILFVLLKQRQQDVQIRDDLEEKARRLHDDYERVSALLLKERSRLEASEREVANFKAKLSVSEKNIREQVEKSRKLNEELTKMKSNLQLIKTQYAHEIRKKDTENIKLKDRIQKGTSVDKSSKKPQIRLLNPIAPVKSIRRTGSSISDGGKPADLTKDTLMKYQEREEKIIHENGQLRNTLYVIHQELVKMLESDSIQALGMQGNESVVASTDIKHELKLEHFRLPCEFIINDIDSETKALVEELHLILEIISSMDLEPKTSNTNDDAVIALTTKLDKYRSIIAEQQKLLELAVNKQNDATAVKDLERKLEDNAIDLIPSKMNACTLTPADSPQLNIDRKDLN
ncbi:hypothetical protein K493DRAFT_93478 [Basidiobolus meristosporus CBS 931.73]|uniref:Uncharacterized protein n=1 Tax=Basidiobolus meristosporus CBS 931.73 TaxID=1314790 RepID=A0A1Y1X7S9_9FUNG|nr:hypothetical protein K493DRAFT_93478 [Basidiobolus meristosporus CBS 931.73]|eukprot:ORX81811.1 hypothetical protein K493DRAFT_93478 [Basidiobolus meristosporus CBS 931.73]